MFQWNLRIFVWTKLIVTKMFRFRVRIMRANGLLKACSAKAGCIQNLKVRLRESIQRILIK